MKVHVKIECLAAHCAAEQVWEGDVPEDRIAVVALWFHAAHEGHQFRWTENGQVILDALRSE